MGNCDITPVFPGTGKNGMLFATLISNARSVIFSTPWTAMKNIMQCLISNEKKGVTCRLLLYCGLLLITISPTFAGNFQPHEQIRQAARDFILDNRPAQQGKTVLEVGTLDRRLKLPLCNRPLQAFSSPGKQQSRKLSVGIRCDGTNPWSIYVPVTIHIRKKILTAAREIPRGTTLEPYHLALTEQDITRLHRGFFTHPERVVGKTVKRTLHPGDVITPGRLTAATIIKRGQRVIILAKSGGITVRMAGKALSDGARGERIRVQNKSSKRRIEARATAPGIVEVDM